MIRRIVDRCHVAESNLAVVRYVLSTMKKGGFWKCSKADRKDLIKKIISVHQENRELFRHYRF